MNYCAWRRGDPPRRWIMNGKGIIELVPVRYSERESSVWQGTQMLASSTPAQKEQTVFSLSQIYWLVAPKETVH